MVTKKEKNPITNKTEEYRIIKISQDHKNEYFLKIRVPDGYLKTENEKMYKSRFGNVQINNFFKKNNYFEIFKIGRGVYPNKSLNTYVNWRRGYIDNKYEVIDSFVEYDNSSDGFKSALIFYETKCLPSTKNICFSGQRQLAIIKAYKKNNEPNKIWDIQYGSFLDGDLTKEERLARIDQLKSMAKNCCEIISKEILR